jgi:hypothetical protein
MRSAGIEASMILAWSGSGADASLLLSGHRGLGRFELTAKFIPELWVICMAMCRDGVLGCGLEDFLLRSGYGQ